MAEQCTSETKDFEAAQCERPAENEVSGLEVEKLECAVCLQGCVHPVELPCGHIFCFLCVKGVANQSKRCAMCRKELPSGYLEHPQLVSVLDLEQACAYEDGQQWFYEGHNGWWQYDERTSTELEIAFKRGDHTCELLIAGFLYVIDFEHMVQLRRNDPSRRRRIKRDLATISKKGIAGLRLHEGPTAEAPGPEDGADRDNDGAEGDEEAGAPSASGASLQVLTNMRFPRSGLPQFPTTRAKSPSPIPTAPNNTPQTPHTPSQDSGTSSPTMSSNPSLQQIVQGMQNVRLNGDLDEDEIL